jgi:23S rRNA-/tRNA-specific pseudouridylate synthase
MKHTPLEILFEDPFLCIINKPSGIHSVAQSKSESENSVAKQLIEINPLFQTASPKPLDAGLVNRLDYETSGILIAAKKIEIWETLFENLKAERINKSYLTILDGRLPRTERPETWIYSRYRGSKKVSQKAISETPPERSLAAKSVFSPLKFNTKRNVTLASVTAHSARRHQVRAHAAWLGVPLCGDALYGSRRHLNEVLNAVNFPTFALHAHRVDFSHPVTDENISITAPVDAKLYDQSFSTD